MGLPNGNSENKPVLKIGLLPSFLTSTGILSFNHEIYIASLQCYWCSVSNSCTDFFSQTLETEPPEYNKNRVFHTLLSDQDSVVRVVLSRNYGIFDNVQGDKTWFVRGAKAEWWVNGAKLAI